MGARRVGERVIVFPGWGSFDGKRGVVTQLAPYVMVHLDDERLPMRFDDHVLIPEEESASSIGGAE
jgi:hypothetical protein